MESRVRGDFSLGSEWPWGYFSYCALQCHCRGSSSTHLCCVSCGIAKEVTLRSRVGIRGVDFQIW